MRGTAMLDELMNLARRQGLTVRREALSRGVSSGGLCMLKGVPTVFVDDRVGVEAQIEVLASVLKRYDWSTVFLHPALRAMLGTTGDGSGEGETQPLPGTRTGVEPS